MRDVAPAPIPFDDRRIKRLIRRVQRDIRAWAEREGLWNDVWLKVPHEHRGECPQSSDLFLICADGDLHEVWNGGADARLEREFQAILEKHGCWYELDDHVTASVHPDDDNLATEVLRFQRFDWIRKLAADRAFDVHAELYRHFAEHPSDLRKLGWREFEVVLDGIFRNCGFRTELGPGRGDAGVDLRLYQGDLISELVTLVQAKRWRRTPVGLETVAAMSGLVEADKAHRGLIVATSRFLPGARNWAEVQSKRVTLAGLEEVQGWCDQISEGLAAFLDSGRLDDARLMRHSESLTGPLVGKVVHARGGYNIVANWFCKVLAETKYEVVLEPLESRRESGDGQSGTEVPVTDRPKAKAERFIAFRKQRGFWGGGELYFEWDGKPVDFDSRD